MRLDFDDNFYKLLRAKNDYKKQILIIGKILKENVEKYNPPDKVKNEKILTEINYKGILSLNGQVKNLCELKKNKFLIANIINKANNNEEISIFRKEENENSKKYEYFISTQEEGEIISLVGLKNDKLLMVKTNQFKILKIDEYQNEIKEIQKFDLCGDVHFKQIIELINGYLVSITYSNTNNNEIVLWKKNLINENYDKIGTVKKKRKPLGILEIDKHYFLVNYEGNKIRIYESKTVKRIFKKTIKNQLDIKKMIKIDEYNFLMINTEYTILFNLKYFQIKILDTQNYINDILYISNSNNYFYSVVLKNNTYIISLLYLNLYKDKIISFIGEDIKSEEKINCIYELSDGTIANGCDKDIKLWEIK